MKNSLVAGTIAGAVAGIVPFSITHMGAVLGFWSIPHDIPFLANQITVHMGSNAIWGAIFSFVAVMIYDRVPGKGVVKGLYIGLIYCLFANLYVGYSLWAYGIVGFAINQLIHGTMDKFVYGILFSHLYEK